MYSESLGAISRSYCCDRLSPEMLKQFSVQIRPCEVREVRHVHALRHQRSSGEKRTNTRDKGHDVPGPQRPETSSSKVCWSRWKCAARGFSQVTAASCPITRWQRGTRHKQYTVVIIASQVYGVQLQCPLASTVVDIVLSYSVVMRVVTPRLIVLESATPLPYIQYRLCNLLECNGTQPSCSLSSLLHKMASYQIVHSRPIPADTAHQSRDEMNPLRILFLCPVWATIYITWPAHFPREGARRSNSKRSYTARHVRGTQKRSMLANARSARCLGQDYGRSASAPLARIW